MWWNTWKYLEPRNIKRKPTNYQCVMKIYELLLQHLKYDISKLFWWGEWHSCHWQNAPCWPGVALRPWSSMQQPPTWTSSTPPSWQEAGRWRWRDQKSCFSVEGRQRIRACPLPAKVESSCTWPAEGAASVARVLLLPFQVNKNAKTVIETLVWRQRNYSCAALIWVEDIYNTLVDTLV